MGKASSSKKVARAARTAGRGRAGRSYGWSAAVTGIVILGIVLIVVSRGGSADAVAPKLGDHWHAAYGIYDCDHFLPPLTDVVQPDETGLHTHGDSLMHMHPFGTRYTGKGANIGNWGITVGLEVTDTSIKAAGIDKKNGDTCGDEAATLQLKVWSGPDDETGRLIEKDFADYNPQEFTLWTLAFVPEGTDIPKPPPEAIESLRAPSDVSGATTPSSLEISPTTEPGSTETTAPETSTPSTEPSTPVTTAAP